jgi:dolichol-phosphate mannosyltransferase
VVAVTAGEAAGSLRWGGTEASGRLLAALRAWHEDRLPQRSPQLSVVVPAFREAANLPLVCDRLLAALEGRVDDYEILLVDDASPDETYRVACELMWRSPRIRALTKSPPRGMGNAIRRGLEQARAPHVAITMGDGSDEVERIPEMLAKVRDEGYGLAIGSRYRYRRNYQTVPWIYRFWSSIFRLCTRLSIGLRLSDYTNAFRVFDRRIFARYGPESGGFEISPEITFKAWFATRRVAEVDVCHLKRASGQSSFSFLRAGPGYGKILTKAFVNRLTGRWFTLDW